jgi:hypothetical protein
MTFAKIQGSPPLWEFRVWFLGLTMTFKYVISHTFRRIFIMREILLTFNVFKSYQVFASSLAHASKMNPIVHPIFEPKTSSWQYIVVCPKTKDCAIIDPVLDYDLGNFVVSTQSADALLKIVRKHHLRVTHLLETHAHTDHLSAAYYIQATLWTKGHPNAPI